MEAPSNRLLLKLISPRREISFSSAPKIDWPISRLSKNSLFTGGKNSRQAMHSAGRKSDFIVIIIILNIVIIIIIIIIVIIITVIFVTPQLQDLESKI